MCPDELSQEDIDALLSGGAVESEMSADDTGGDSALLSQEELEAVLSEGGEKHKVEAPEFASFSSIKSGGSTTENTLDMLYDVHLDVKIELGRCEMMVEDILKLNDGSVVELEKLAGDPVDIIVNGKLIAKGEILVLNDQFCVRITDIISPRERLDATLK